MSVQGRYPVVGVNKVGDEWMRMIADCAGCHFLCMGQVSAYGPD